jgi:hypothetical protein
MVLRVEGEGCGLGEGRVFRDHLGFKFNLEF